MIQVVPAIIPKTKEQLEEEIHRVAKFAPLIQIDISDGIFTPYKTWPYNDRDVEYFEKLKTEEQGWPQWEDVDFEVHLMVRDPENVVAEWIRTGATTIIAHVDASNNFQKVIDTCKETGVTLGIAIKPSTHLEVLQPFMSQVSFIQVMGSDLLGKHGTELDPKAVEMISSLRKLYPQSIIAIDIGVTTETAGELVEAGANKLVSGSEILNADNPEEVYHELESIS